jgi:hypothetical protein
MENPFWEDKGEKSVPALVKCNQERTDRVELTVVIYYGSTDITPSKTCPSVIQRSARQRKLCIPSGVIECGGSPRRYQCAPIDENEIFHALDRQSAVLCPVEPGGHIVSDVFLKHFRVDDILTKAPIGKRQKCSATAASIRDTFGPARP